MEKGRCSHLTVLEFFLDTLDLRGTVSIFPQRFGKHCETLCLCERCAPLWYQSRKECAWNTLFWPSEAEQRPPAWGWGFERKASNSESYHGTSTVCFLALTCVMGENDVLLLHNFFMMNPSTSKLLGFRELFCWIWLKILCTMYNVLCICIGYFQSTSQINCLGVGGWYQNFEPCLLFICIA